MKKLDIFWLTDEPRPGILVAPWGDIEEVTDLLNGYIKTNGSPVGILAPYDTHRLPFTVQCYCRLKDRFPSERIYTHVAGEPTTALRSLQAIGAKNIIVPKFYWYANEEFDYFFQFIDPGVVDSLNIHVSGGKFTRDQYNRDNWTYSEEWT